MLLCFGEYKLDTELFELHCGDDLCQLEPQVFDLLCYLIKHRGRVISRQELLDELWAGKIVTDSTLSSRIKAARHAVGDSGQEQNCIATFNRRGYRFVAAVKELDENITEEVCELVGLFSDQTGSQHDRPSVAVLPFTYNTSGSDTIAWTASMLSEDISIQLSRIPGFLVISRNSTSHYRDLERDIKRIGKDLRTDYVVDGSVWEVGNQLRVSVQLIESSSARLLWADRTEVSAGKLGEFQDDVVREIVSRLEPELSRAELTALKQRRPADLDAWALYLKGHAILSLKGWSEESFSESADLLRQAILHDEEMAFAHAYLALILSIGNLIGLVSDKGCHEEAMVAAEAAIALDSQDSDVLGYAGCAFADMGEFQRGIGMMRHAIELDPSNAQAHAALGAALLKIGEEEGIDEIRYGIRISPRDSRLAIWGTMLARGLLSLGRVDEAIEAASSACHCDDKIFLPRLVLAVAQNSAGNPDASRAALEDARRIRPQLSINDISRFASPEEIDELKKANLV